MSVSPDDHAQKSTRGQNLRARAASILKSRFARFYMAPTLLVMAMAVAPLVSGSGTLYHRDVLVSHYPLKAAHAQVMADGHFMPLIDPYRSGGQPLMGNPNALPFYPTNLLYRIAEPLWALNAHFWLHLLAAPLALFWLARVWGLSRPAAWAAASTYAVSGYVLSLMNLYNLVAAAVWVPAFAAACLRAGQDRRAGPSVAITLTWTLLILGGDPMTALLGGVLGLSTWLLRRPVQARAATVSLVVSVTLGTLIAAPMWIEFLRILPLSYRGYWRYSVATSLAQSWNPWTVLDWIVPFFFGNLDYNFWGYSFFGGNPPLLYSLFPGVLAIALVLAAGLPGRSKVIVESAADGSGPGEAEQEEEAPGKTSGKASDESPSETHSTKRLQIWCWAWIGAGAFVAAGFYNPVMHWLYQLPGASALRYPVKVWILVAITASLLAGVGFERFLAGDRRLSRILGFATLGYGLLWVALIILPPPLAKALQSLNPEVLATGLFAHQRLQWATTTFFVLIGCLVLWLTARQADRRSAFHVGAVLLVLHTALQSFLLNPLIATDESSHYTGLPEVARSLPPGSRVAHGTFSEIFGPRDKSIFPKLPGTEFFWLTREEFASFAHFSAVPHGYRFELNQSPEGLDSFFSLALGKAFKNLDDLSRVRLLAAAGTEHLLLPRPLDASAEAQATLVTRTPGSAFDTWHYALERVLPEHQVVGKVRRADDMNQALSLLADPDLDPRVTAVLPAPGPELDGPGGTAELVSESLERMEVTVSSPSGGLLTTRRAWLPIYRAWVDGEPATVEKVNIYKLGVLVPAGEHSVVIATDRRPTLAAAATSFTALAFVLFSAGHRRRKTRPELETEGPAAR